MYAASSKPVSLKGIPRNGTRGTFPAPEPRWSGPLGSHDLLGLVGWVTIKEREGDSGPAWGKDRMCFDGAHGPLNHFPLLAACPWAGLTPSPGAGWPRISHLFPQREELSVTFCHREDCVPAAVGMTCSESCEAAAFTYREKKKEEKAVPYSWKLPKRPSSYQALLTSRGFLCCCSLAGSGFSPRTPLLIILSPAALPLQLKAAEGGEGLRDEGQSWPEPEEREEGELSSWDPAPSFSHPPPGQREGRAGKQPSWFHEVCHLFWLQIPTPS